MWRIGPAWPAHKAQRLYRPRAVVSTKAAQQWLHARPIRAIALAILLVGLQGCAPSEHPATLTIFAAASLTDALTDVADQFPDGDHTIVFSFAGSNTLRDQIQHGAQADIFVSAHPSHMDAVESEGLLVDETRRDILSNRLVLVVGRNSPTPMFPPSSTDPLPFDLLAIAEPDAVPAGMYAMEALRHFGLAGRIGSRLVPSLDVRAALAYAESGNVDAAIVYATDASMSDRVRVVYEFPAESHAPILYPAAILRTTANRDLAEHFLDFLASEDAAQTFAKYGFQRAPGASVGQASASRS